VIELQRAVRAALSSPDWAATLLRRGGSHGKRTHCQLGTRACLLRQPLPPRRQREPPCHMRLQKAVLAQLSGNVQGLFILVLPWESGARARAGHMGADAAPAAAAAPAVPALAGAAAEAALAAWAAADAHAEWAPVEWLGAAAAPALVGALRMVPPADETEALRCARARAMLSASAPYRYLTRLTSAYQVRCAHIQRTIECSNRRSRAEMLDATVPPVQLGRLTGSLPAEGAATTRRAAAAQAALLRGGARNGGRDGRGLDGGRAGAALRGRGRRPAARLRARALPARRRAGGGADAPGRGPARPPQTAAARLAHTAGVLSWPLTSKGACNGCLRRARRQASRRHRAVCPAAWCFLDSPPRAVGPGLLPQHARTWAALHCRMAPLFVPPPRARV